MFCTSFSFLPAPATGSIGVLINKAFEKCQKQYLKIKSQSPVFNVIKIVLDPLGDGCIATVAIHLRPPGHTRTYLMLDHVTRDLFLEAFYKIWTLRPWSHQAHAAKQHVEQLRHLVDTGLADHPADGGHPWVALRGPFTLFFFRCLHLHGTELVHLKRTVMQ